MKFRCVKAGASQALVEKMKVLVCSLSENAQRIGIEIQPYRADSLTHFASLPIEEQERVYNNFWSYYEILASSCEMDISLEDDKQMFWWALKKLDLRPCSGFLEHVEHEDIIEIYDANGVQIYRNLNFFRICSYSLDELLSASWFDLFERNEDESMALYGKSEEIFQGKHRHAFYLDFDHEIRETYSEKRNTILVKHKYMAPLLDEFRQPAALVITSGLIQVKSQ
ncbi:hypothetical protein [Pseudobacteriovorax antillogorgiicola]|uniref:PAS fold-containing protein n=1 Tax=Pseudobacteriovorax antillogorgiicola TaxID=1513793 RepID=A0A1Y6CL80_9BACT|nr:hypothetical protein [Pseudobacteriovorax antillogorgiicola]TCS45682.1 hypothetical protein EDD56_12776 [Pseudobacteriovorax antillogorgiicola]SMF73194.1 hypothetical protein SAMN06296036_12775 [Pseudobacteriovorax antillogorgiicola]